MSKTDHILQLKFEEIFKEHFTGLVYFAQKYLGDHQASKDLVHAVFTKIWEDRETFDFEKPAKSFLFTAVYNRSMNYLRDNKRFVDTGDTAQAEVLESSAYSDTMEVAELEGKINNAIARLPEKCREVFELNRFEGKKYKEIAELLNISIKTVENQMSKALKYLKDELKDYIYLFILFLLKNDHWL